MFRLPLFLGLVLGVSSYAEDLVTLSTGDVFTGEVEALADGIITLRSPHSETPFRVRNANLQRLIFRNTDTSDLPKDSQMINLRNGDTFPGELTSLDGTNLTFRTWFAGELELPRTQVQSLFFGVTPQRSLYLGPQSLSEWDQGKERLWEFHEDRLRSTDRGTIGRNFDLPGNFIFNFRFSWQNTPNLRVHLCTDSVTQPGETKYNGYLVSVNNQGVTVKRVNPDAKGNSQYQDLAAYPLQLRDHQSQSIQIELRIDRDNRMFRLAVDGVEVAPGFDPAPPPRGGHIAFESHSSGRRDVQISEIQLQEWDTKTQRFRSEARTNEQTDTLTVDDGDRFGGEILSYDPASEEKTFVVKSPQSDEPISIPLQNCSVMFFTKPEGIPDSQGEYRLDLRSGGSLTLSAIKLKDQFLEATHPWLGKMTVDRRIMSSIGRAQRPEQ